MTFEFSTASAIRFGPGRISESGALARQFGSSALVAVGKHPERAEDLLRDLRKNGLEVLLCRIGHEPTVDDVEKAAQIARESDCDIVVGMGGGSVLDAAKAAAALVTNPGRLLDYLEVIGGGKTLANPPAPFMAIPTTSGTGTEVTSNAVITFPPQSVKVSLRSPLMIPKIALVDPLLAVSCPPDVTAASGLDALSQLIEPFVCIRPNPLIDELCRDGIERVRRSLRKAFENGNDPAAREDMALAALESGMALSNAKLGAVHGIAAPLGGTAFAPHGALCARLLPPVMETNVRILRRKNADSMALERYTEIARILTGNPSASAEEGTEWIRILVEDFGIPPLSHWGIKAEDVPGIAEKSLRASSMKGNPVPLGVEDIVQILSKAM